jgi:hypothetical protein
MWLWFRWQLYYVFCISGMAGYYYLNKWMITAATEKFGIVPMLVLMFGVVWPIIVVWWYIDKRRRAKAAAEPANQMEPERSRVEPAVDCLPQWRAASAPMPIEPQVQAISNEAPRPYAYLSPRLRSEPSPLKQSLPQHTGRVQDQCDIH